MSGLSFYLKKFKKEIKETQSKQKKENNEGAKINEIINRKTMKQKYDFLRR